MNLTKRGSAFMLDIIIKARKNKGYTQKQVAELAKVSEEYISLIESGKRKPSVKVAKKLGAVLDIQWTIFFEK